MRDGKKNRLLHKKKPIVRLFANVFTIYVLFLFSSVPFYGCSCRRDKPIDSQELPREKTYEIESNDLINLDDLDPKNPELPSEVGGIEIPPNVDQLQRIENETTDPLPPRFDWRDEGVVAPVRKQTCGDCWAFAACAVAESVYAIDTGTLHDISEQWLLDCNQEGWSCAGGRPPFSYFVNKADSCGGIGGVLETSKPYLGYEGDCACDTNRLGPLAYWGIVSTHSNPAPVNAVKRTIRDHGPVWAGILAGVDFTAYRGGVFNLRKTPPPIEPHAVVITGWDDSEGEEGVWLVRNSWGTSWGEQGTARVEYGAGGLGEILVVCLTNKPQEISGSGDGDGGEADGGGGDGGGGDGGDGDGGEADGGEADGGEADGGEADGGDGDGGEADGGEAGLLKPTPENASRVLTPSQAAKKADSLLREANRKKNVGKFNDAYIDANEGWKIVQVHKKTDSRCSDLEKKLQQILKEIEPRLDKFYPGNKKYQVD